MIDIHSIRACLVEAVEAAELNEAVYELFYDTAHGDVDAAALSEMTSKAVSLNSKSLNKLRDLIEQVPDGLQEALDEQREGYQDAKKFFDEKMKNFCGMNKDRPVKHSGMKIFESAILLHAAITPFKEDA